MYRGAATVFVASVAMKTFGERVKFARETAKLKQAELGRLVGTSAQTIQAIEDPDKKTHTSRFLLEIARKTGFRPDWLAKGTGPMREDGTEPMQAVAVAGYVGAGQEVVPFDPYPTGEGLYKVMVPASLGIVVAVEVRGDSMWPRYADGEVIAYDRNQSDPRELIGQECIIRLRDGHMYLKRLRKGSKVRLFDLISHNAEPLADQEVEWAARVKYPSRTEVGRARIF